MPLSESERRDLKDALHKLNNALNSISMQAELARMYVERKDDSGVLEALDTVMAQCRKASTVTHDAQRWFENDAGAS
ncbi:MAG TPA: hypothetical protein VKZ85_09170 [Woeseiaceae bacterium]|nr:hypothetical protein [Woeseiaceae bacterium]